MVLVANVEGESLSIVDASWRREAPCRRWRRSVAGGMDASEDGVLLASWRRGCIVLSMMLLWVFFAFADIFLSESS